MERRRSKHRAAADSCIFQLSYARSALDDVRSFKTLDELLLKLAYDREDAVFRQEFLKAYVVFPNVTPQVLLDAFRTLWDVFVEVTPSSSRFPASLDEARLCVAHVMEEWVTSRPADMDKKVKKRMLEFVDGVLDGLDGLLADQLQRIRSKVAACKSKSRSALPRSLQTVDGLDVVPDDQALGARSLLAHAGKAGVNAVVDQLTLLESQTFALITTDELLRMQWVGDDRDSCPTHYFLTWFNRVSSNIGCSIAQEEQEKAQTALLKRAIGVASRAHAIGNYNLMMEVITGLFRHTLVCTAAWEALPGKQFDSFISLCQLMAPSANYAAYRADVNEVTRARVPYVACLLSDLQFADEFNDTSMSNGLNFVKAQQLGSIVSEWTDGVQSYEIAKDAALFDDLRSVVLSSSPLRTVLATSMEVDEATATPRMRSLHLNLVENFVDPAYLWERVDVPIREQKMRRRDWKIIETGSSKLHFKKDDIIFEPLKDTKTSFYLVKYGQVRVEFFGAVIRTIREGTIFGDSSILEPLGRHEHSIYIAETNCMIQAIDPNLLSAMLASDPRLAQRFFSHLARDLVDRLSQQHAKSQPQLGKRRKRSRAQLTRSRSRLVKQLTTRGSKDNKDERDSEYCTLFSLTGNHLVIKEYRAGMVVSGIPSNGTLYVSSEYVCFYSKVFSYKSKVAIEMHDILDVACKTGKLVLQISKRKKEFVFRFKDDGAEEDARSLISSLRSSRPASQQPRKRRGTTGGTGGASGSEEQAPQQVAVGMPKLGDGGEGQGDAKPWEKLALSAEDWEMVLQGAKSLKFKPGETVLEQGKKYQRIFQVVKGKCQVEQLKDPMENSGKDVPAAEDEATLPMSLTDSTSLARNVRVLTTMSPGEMFGEISFVRGNAASASVRALTHAQVCVIEGTAINRLVQVHPALGAKFLHYVCSVLAFRLYGRLFFETREESSTRDIIVEPLQLNLENVGVKAADDGEVIHAVQGPLEEEEEDEHSRSAARAGWVCGKAISTYPRRRAGYPRDGHPICDQYMARFFPNRIVASIADGCNWGNLPRDAARRAIKAFVDYMCAHQNMVREVAHAGTLVLRAFAMAQAAVIGDDPDTPVGSTTLLGGILVELDDEELDSPSDAASKVRAPKWGFIYGSVGDTKAFHYSHVTNEWHDITENNRVLSRDATDCGGRLGRMTSENGPDLRNFELGFYPCDVGDFIMLVSDGVHDNLDPESLGKDPPALGMACDTWAETPLDEAEVAKSKFRLRLLRSLLNPSGGTPEPSDAVATMLEYCEGVNKAAIDWMCANPSKPLPKDYKAYPGKMDHTTCLAFVVGGQAS